jgi:hypothetical protein
MKPIEVHVHTRDGEEPHVITIDEDATIEELLAQVKGHDHGEFCLVVESEDKPRDRHHRLRDCGIRHGHHVHCRHNEYRIVVNGREKMFPKAEISFEEVVTIAFREPNFAKDTYTVTYWIGEEKKEGSLVKGQSVHVKQCMVFTVVWSGSS